MTKILVVEGLDYAGKTSTINLLRQALAQDGWEVTLLREPGGSLLGDSLKKLLIDPAIEMDEKTRLMLFFSSRNEMVQRHLIDLDVNEKRVVIIDRYLASTFAYTDRSQWAFLWGLKTLLSPPPPDLTVYLKIDKETLHERAYSAKRDIGLDGIEVKVLRDHEIYLQRYDDYFDRADNGDLLVLPAKNTIDSHVFRILTALGRLP